MPLRPQFREALELLAAATESLIAKGYAPPILVGGAAVEIYTGGAVTSGDFDFVSPWRDEFFAELRAVGFKAPDRPGWLKWALLHPDLDFGVQVVSKPLMDGKADTNRIMLVDLTAEDAAKSLKLFLISVEVHIPTKPAGYPEVMSATHSNLIAATVPISSRPGDAVSSGRFW